MLATHLTNACQRRLACWTRVIAERTIHEKVVIVQLHLAGLGDRRDRRLRLANSPGARKDGCGFDGVPIVPLENVVAEEGNDELSGRAQSILAQVHERNDRYESVLYARAFGETERNKECEKQSEIFGDFLRFHILENVGLKR